MKRLAGLCVFLIAFVSQSSLSLAQNKPVVAVFNIEDQGAGLSKILVDRLSKYLATRLAESAGYAVVPRSDLQKRLQEQKKASFKQCYDQSCQIELGRELAAEKTVSAQIMKIGKKCTLTLNIYDLKKATTEAAASSDRGACDEEGLITLLEQVAKKISLKEPTPAKSAGNASTAAAAITKYDFIGRWDFLHSGNRVISRDTKDNSSDPCIYNHYWVEFALNGSGELDYKSAWRVECTYSTRSSIVWDYNRPGSCGTTNLPKDDIMSLSYKVSIEKVMLLEDLKVVAVTMKNNRTNELFVENYALTPDKTKLVPLSQANITYAIQGKLDELVKRHMVETVDPEMPNKTSTTIIYGVKKNQ
jgi:hypothetical protein